MVSTLRKWAGSWIAVAVFAGTVLLAGARLVQLSLHQTAAQTRAHAQALANNDARSLSTQLDALAAQAAGRAAAVADAKPWRPGRKEFWLGTDGKLLGDPGEYRTDAATIAAVWAQPANARAQVLGPIRVGSRWLVAVRAPLQPQSAIDGRPIGWSVVYRDLDELLLGAQLDRVGRMGYDFELSQLDPAGRPVPVTGSGTAALSDAVTSPVELPAAAAPAGHWMLAVRPRAGWFPASALAVDVSLLVLVTWLVALAVRDASRHFVQLRSALAVSKRRLHEAHLRLAQEIERRDQLQKSFDYAHLHDSFTGLPNRQYFLGKLDSAMRDLRARPERCIALLLIAIDRFKLVTDTLGHTAGDELMLEITRVFGQALGGYEHALARWTEDELALLLSDVPDAAAAPEVAGALQLALQVPIELRRHRVIVAATIGATFVDSGLRRIEEVVREADIALSAARDRGSGAGFAAYSAAMQSNLLELVSLEADLQLALERDEFRLLFQPIVDLRARRVVGVEALLRWLHPVHGLLTPQHFLDLAEDAGLAVPITHWVIGRVCELSRQWRQRMPPEKSFYVSVNLSPSSLLDPELGKYVGHALAATETSAGNLKFELTENGLISNAGAARDALDRLHNMGIELMLDDFGTGYSSLSHLQLFPFDYIKIDGPFDARQQPAQGHSTLVRAIAQMATTLGLKTIAEIVETSDAAHTLEELGCGYAQGNAFCEPVDAEQAIQRLCKQILEPLDEHEGQALHEEFDDSQTMILPVLSETEMS